MNLLFGGRPKDVLRGFIHKKQWWTVGRGSYLQRKSRSLGVFTLMVGSIEDPHNVLVLQELKSPLTMAGMTLRNSTKSAIQQRVHKIQRRNIRTDIKGGMCKTFTGVTMRPGVEYRSGVSRMGYQKKATLFRCNANYSVKVMIKDMTSHFDLQAQLMRDVEEHIRSLM